MRIYLRCWAKDCDILIFQRRGEETIWPLAADWWHRGNAAHMAKQYFCYIFWNSAFDSLDSHVWKYAITRLFRTSCTALDFRQPALDRFSASLRKQVGRGNWLSLPPVLPAQIMGPFGPLKKLVNFDTFQKHQKCILCILTPNHLTKINYCCPTVFYSINKAEIGPLTFFCY